MQAYLAKWLVPEDTHVKGVVEDMGRTKVVRRLFVVDDLEQLSDSLEKARVEFSEKYGEDNFVFQSSTFVAADDEIWLYTTK